jgi:pimeloyl-ACP methyl ester carboxylesterase
MAKVDINGIGIAYEIIGTGSKTAAITPGGRFAKETPGVRELAEELAKHDFRVLIWDRPNCGESDVCFDGDNESYLNADAYAGLLRKLNFGPTLLIGGSAGARVTLLTGVRHPDVVSGLFLLWITGGIIGLTSLAVHYCATNAVTARAFGMEAVAKLPEWEEQIRRNEGNRDRILAQDPDKFVKTMEAWADAFIPKSAAPVPGLVPAELEAFKFPVTVLRSGNSDLYHTREASELVASMIPTASLQEPPWGDTEWNDRLFTQATNPGLFQSWPKLAPQILELAKKI